MPVAMNPTIRGTAALLAALALTACTAPGGTTGHAAHHPRAAGEPSSQADGMTTGTAPGTAMSGGQSGAATMHGAPSGQMQPGQVDMNQMCAMHRNMQKMPQEQHHAMMEQHMKGMSPEMRQQHMEMMRQQCQ